MKMRHLRIGIRLSLGFGLVLCLLAAIIATAIGLSTLQRNQMQEAMSLASAKEHLSGEMRAALLVSAVAMRNVALESDVVAFQRWADKARAERKRYNEVHEELEALKLTKEESDLLAESTRLHKAIEQPFTQAVALAQAMSAEDAIKVMITQVDPVQQRQITQINLLRELQEAETKRVTEKINETGARLNATLLALGLVALAAGAVFSWACTRSITLPLSQAVRVAKRVSAGDLADYEPDSGKDEMAQLLTALQMMTSQLRQVVCRVRDTASGVTRTAQDIVNDQGDLSSRTEAQAASLEETAATMGELTANVQTTAERAQAAYDLVLGAAREANEGRDMVGRVVQTMTSIHRSAGRIAEINSVIDGIAFQTNILALNAAVEAARAGEQGRGFAVVASEVRQLAQRSATAAKEIKQLVNESVGQTAVGAELVDSAGQTMGKIVDNFDRVRTIVKEIASSSREQSQGISQVNDAVAQIDDVTQKNATLVETATASASQLSNQASALMRAVAVFRTDAVCAPADNGVRAPDPLR
jgi:methyl-accepting chemotaxis protein